MAQQLRSIDAALRALKTGGNTAVAVAAAAAAMGC